MKPKQSHLSLRILFHVACVALLCVASAPTAVAQRNPDRPAIEDLLPETTVALVQIPDIRDVMQKTMDGTTGLILEDEAIVPIRDRIIEETYSAYSKVEGAIGMSLDEMTSIPSGEMVFAAIAPRRSSPVYMVILESGEENAAANKAFDLAMERVADDEENEVEKAELDSGAEVDKVIFDGQPIFIAKREGLIIGCSSEKVLDEFFIRWDGGVVKKVRPLSKNRKFVTIMNRCRSRKDLPNDVRFFFDPVAMIKSSGRGNIGMQTAIAVFPALGVDSILALGGSIILSDDEYESILHGHLLLSNPRKGITKVISLKPGDYEPEDWVPSKAFFYTTTSWDVPQMFQETRDMVDLIAGEGSFARNVTTPLEENFEMSLEEEILPLFAGRVSMASVGVDEGKVNPGSSIVGLALKDVEQATETLAKLIEKLNTDNENLKIEKREFQDCTYWIRSDAAIADRNKRSEERNKRIEERRAKRQAEEKDDEESKRRARRRETWRNLSKTFRVPRPCLGIVNNSLIFCDSLEALEEVVLTHKGESTPLRNEEGFLTMVDRVNRLLDADTPVAMYYNNPRNQLEAFLAYMNADSTKTALSDSSENSDFMKSLKNIVDADDLPAIEAFEKYMVPQGGFVTSDDTGYHFLWFQERLELEE